MLQPLKTGATYEDLCAVDELLIAELIDGDLYASARPPILYVHAASALLWRIGAAVDRGREDPGAWLVLHKPEIHLRDDAIVPDMAAWRCARIPEKMPDYFDFAPDWLCEVLAPNTEALDRTKKLAVYAREGVSHAWLLNPAIQTLEVLRLESQRWSLIAAHEGSARVRAEPFTDIELDLAGLWA
jgi:Uma2 family endonuclease